MPYVDPQIPADETQLAEQVIARFTEIDPDWVPAEGDVETLLAEAVASPVATAVAIVLLNMRGAYMEIFGQYLLKLPRGAATAAAAIVTITLADTAGYTLNDGSPFGLTLDGEQKPFVLPEPLTWAPGDAAAKTGVRLVSADLGADLNGAGGPVTWSDARISAVTVTAIATGGADEQAEDDYLTDITDAASDLTDVMVTAPQYARFTKRWPGVDRCAYFNRTDPTAPGVDSPGHILLVPIDTDGAGFADDSDVLEGLADAPQISQADRAVQINVHFGRPVAVAVDVVMNVQANPTYGDLEIKAAVEQAIRAGAAGGVWDYDSTAPGYWRPSTKSFTSFDAARYADGLPHLRRVLSCTVNGGASVPLTAFPVALPNIGTVTVNVTR